MHIGGYLGIQHFLQTIIPNRESLQNRKIMIMAGVALAGLGAAIWSAIKKMQIVAVAILAASVGIEIALMILLPNRRKNIAALDQDFKPTPALSSVIEELERCYPIKAVDPTKRRDQQIAGLMGQACGDAIGLFTEFTTQKQAEEMIDGKPIELGSAWPGKFVNGHNWNHIKRFVKNGWTDDTDQALSLVRALYRKWKLNDQQEPFESLFAQELMKWRNGGLAAQDPFIGRSNPYCMGLGALVSSVLNVNDFQTNPKTAAQSIWAQKPDEPLQNRPAANGAVMRTAPIGLIFYPSLSDVMHYTIEACQVTHADPRCTASSVALTLAIALALRGYDRAAIFEGAEKGALAVLKSELILAAEKKLLGPQESADINTLYESVAADLKAHLHGDWTTLDLDEGWQEKGKINKIGYTFKCMGAAFYALTLAERYQKEGKTDIFRKIIEEIAAQGGDADTNGAAAGALLGVYLGYQNQFPDNWTQNLADSAVIKQAIEHTVELSNLYNGQKKG